MVVFGGIEELLVRSVAVLVVLAQLNVEVGDPAEFSVDISLKGDFRVVGHAGSFDFVLFIRIQLSFGGQRNDRLVAEGLVEELLSNLRQRHLPGRTCDFGD